MKRLFLIGAILFASVSGLMAQQQIPEPTEWDIFQLGFAFQYPIYQNTVKVNGFRIGAPLCGGTATVNGIEAAFFATDSKEVNGIQTAIFATVGENNSGLQFSIVNKTESNKGLQLGIVNIAKKSAFQIGLINYIEDGLLPFTILFNVNF